MQNIPKITLKGDPEELGRQHGTCLKERVRSCYAFYADHFFKKAGLSIKDLGNRFLEITKSFNSDYAVEMTALARAADMEPWEIAALNARTEIFLQANAELIKECTSVYFPKSGILGQNWDWMMPCESFTVLLEIERPDGHRILTLTEAGMLAKIGFNSRGVGVCLNILFGEEAQWGVPVHILLRSLLDSASFEAARQLIDREQTGSYSHILLADEEGRYASLELAGQRVCQADYGDAVPIHTNHYLSEKRDDPEHAHVINSRIRLDRAHELSGSLQNQDLNDIKRILLDSKNGENAICKTYAPLWQTEHGTICSIVMDLSKRHLYLAQRNALKKEFRRYTMDAG